MVHDLPRQIKISLKNRHRRTVSNIKYTKYYVSLEKMVKTEYRGSTYAKNDVVLEPGWVSDAFELREP